MNPHTDPKLLAARVRELEWTVRRLAERILAAHDVIAACAERGKAPAIEYAITIEVDNGEGR